MLSFHETTEEEKYAICAWKYTGEYAVYNLSPYEEQVKSRRGFADPKNNFFSFYDGMRLVGYINLMEEETAVFFGIGVHPEFCNRGYGQRISRIGREISHRRYSGKPVYLEVRTWNTRAVRCYEKAGFRIEGEPFSKTTAIGEGQFFRMEADGEESF